MTSHNFSHISFLFCDVHLLPDNRTLVHGNVTKSMLFVISTNNHITTFNTLNLINQIFNLHADGSLIKHRTQTKQTFNKYFFK